MRTLIIVLSVVIVCNIGLSQSIAPLIPPHHQYLKKTVSDNLSPFLVDLIYELENNPQFIERYKNSSVELIKFLHYKIDNNNRIFVRLKISSEFEGVKNDLNNRNVKIAAANAALKMIDCWLGAEDIQNLAENVNISNISECFSGYLKTGSVTSEGDAIHKTNMVRQYLGADGSGISVGVISDGADSIASAQASGDLPSVVNIIDNSAGGNEGTAMMEIVHDLAPGANLYFSEGFESSLEFINSIHDLANAGCRVIVDDIGYFSEPYFEEGPIASAVRDVIENDNVVYASSAGNSQEEHYEGDYSGVTPNPSIQGINEAHDFGGGDYGQSITLSQAETFYIFLQWSEPFGSAGSNYTLHFVNQAMTTRYNISAVRPNSSDPFVYISATSSGPTTVNIVVEKLSGADRRIELTYNLRGTVNEFNNLPGSINGQPVVEQALAVGAVRYNTPDLLEYFSSIGPSRIYSYPSYTYVERSKPDVVAVDGNLITGAGGFGQEYPPGSGQIRFFGTSAAAPHVAACAAALWSAYPNLNNSEVRQRLLDGAVDLGDPGFDYSYGHGRVDMETSSASPQFTMQGINGGSTAKINDGLSPGDALAEVAGYTFTADQAPYLVYLDSLQFQISGSADAGDINSFSLYADLNKDKIITAADSLLGQLPFSSTLQFSHLGYSFDNNGADIILTADISSSANENHAININLTSPSDVVAYFNVNPFSANFPFDVNDVSLPVELLSFDVQLFKDKAEIKWQTASELNTAYFEVSKTVRGEETVIAKVDAAGSSSTMRFYSITDNDLFNADGIVYKLYSNETNGFREKISEKTVSGVTIDKLELTRIYPNPFNSTIKYKFQIGESAYVLFKIYDVSGKSVATLVNKALDAGRYEISYHADGLSAGLYFIRLTAKQMDGQKKSIARRIVYLK